MNGNLRRPKFELALPVCNERFGANEQNAPTLAAAEKKPNRRNRLHRLPEPHFVGQHRELRTVKESDALLLIPERLKRHLEKPPSKPSFERRLQDVSEPVFHLNDVVRDANSGRVFRRFEKFRNPRVCRSRRLFRRVVAVKLAATVRVAAVFPLLAAVRFCAVPLFRPVQLFFKRVGVRLVLRKEVKTFDVPLDVRGVFAGIDRNREDANVAGTRAEPERLRFDFEPPPVFVEKPPRAKNAQRFRRRDATIPTPNRNRKSNVVRRRARRPLRVLAPFSVVRSARFVRQNRQFLPILTRSNVRVRPILPDRQTRRQPPRAPNLPTFTRYPDFCASSTANRIRSNGSTLSIDLKKRSSRAEISSTPTARPSEPTKSVGSASRLRPFATVRQAE